VCQRSELNEPAGEGARPLTAPPVEQREVLPLWVDLDGWQQAQAQRRPPARREAWPLRRGEAQHSLTRVCARVAAPFGGGKVRRQRPALERIWEGEGYICVPAPWSLKQLPPDFFLTWRTQAQLQYGCKVSFRPRRKSEWTSWDASEGPRNVLVVVGNNCQHFLQDFIHALDAVGIHWHDALPLVEEPGDDGEQRRMVPITSLRVRQAEWQDSATQELPYTELHQLAPMKVALWDPESTFLQSLPARPTTTAGKGWHAPLNEAAQLPLGLTCRGYLPNSLAPDGLARAGCASMFEEQIAYVELGWPMGSSACPIATSTIVSGGVAPVVIGGVCPIVAGGVAPTQPPPKTPHSTPMPSTAALGLAASAPAAPDPALASAAPKPVEPELVGPGRAASEPVAPDELSAPSCHIL